MHPLLRPLSVGELLDLTFALYRRKFLLFVGIAAVTHGLMTVLQESAGVAFQKAGDVASTLLVIVGTIVGLIVYFISNAVSQAATTAAVSEMYLGRNVTILESFALLRGRIQSLTGLVFGVAVLTGLGFLLIIPGIYMTIIWSLAVPAAVVENLRFDAATNRSKDLVDGAWGRVILIMVLVFTLSMLVVIGVSFPVSYLSGDWEGETTLTPFWKIALKASELLGEVLAAPFGLIAFTLTYYDQRVKKEGFDIQLMLEAEQARAAAGPA